MKQSLQNGGNPVHTLHPSRRMRPSSRARIGCTGLLEDHAAHMAHEACRHCMHGQQERAQQHLYHAHR